MTTLSNFSIGSHFAADAAFKARRTMTGAIARMSTGERTIHGHDPAGASVGDSLRTQSRSANVAGRNSQDGISFLVAAESLLMEMAVLNTRLRELAVQKSNGLLSTGEINAITAEENAIVIAADSMKDTDLGDVDLLSEVSIAVSNSGTLAYVGVTKKPELAAGVTNADAQMEIIQQALGEIGAGINALRGHQSNMLSYSVNTEAAASRILDVDFAKESSILAQSSILNQSAMAMVAQANRAQANLLTLLD